MQKEINASHMLTVARKDAGDDGRFQRVHTCDTERTKGEEGGRKGLVIVDRGRGC